jgi:hypothetical protein
MVTVPQVYYNKYSEVFFRYYEVDGCVWYSYYNMTNMLNNNENFVKDFWNNNLNENEKRMFEEEIEDFRHNILINEVQYINTSGLFKLLEAHEKMSGKIRKEVTKFEFEKGYINKDDDNNHALQVNLNMLGQCINEHDNDYEKLYNVAKAVYNAPLVQQLEKSNPVKEKVINEFRNDIYEYDDIEEVEYKISVKDDDREKRLAVYKKFKKSNPDSTLPEWIIDVIK